MLFYTFYMAILLATNGHEYSQSFVHENSRINNYIYKYSKMENYCNYPNVNKLVF